MTMGEQEMIRVIQPAHQQQILLGYPERFRRPASMDRVVELSRNNRPKDRCLVEPLA